MPTTALVLVGGGGTVPPALTKAVGAVGAGGRHHRRTRHQGPVAVAGRPSEGGPVRLDGAGHGPAVRAPGWRHGPARGAARHPGLRLRGRGHGHRSADLEPFLGEAGSLAPWDLTDAIDAGETAKALSRAPPHAGGGRLPPAGGDGHSSTATTGRSSGWTGPGRPRPSRRPRSSALRSAYPAKKALAQIAAPGHRPHRPGHPAPGRGRPRPAGHHPAARGDGARGAGGPAEPSGHPGPVGAEAAVPAGYALTASLDCSPASATFSVHWNPSQ